MEATQEHVMQAQLGVGAGSRLMLRTVNGTVNVRADQTSTIQIRAEGDDVDIREAVEIRQDGDQVAVRTTRGDEIDFNVLVPPDCRVAVYTSNADVNLIGLRAPSSVETTNGDLTLTDLAAPCRLQTAHGSITGRRLSNHLTVESAGGDIQVLSSRLSGLALHTASGDLTIETSLDPKGEYVLHSGSGDTELRLPPTTQATVEVHTLTGVVSFHLPLEIVEPGPRHWKATINGGGTRIMMHSTSGDLRLHGAPNFEAPAGDDEANVFAADPASSMAILRSLESGVISVEDAMAQLDELEGR